MLLHYKSASSAFGVLGETSAGIATPTLISCSSLLPFLPSVRWAFAHSLHIQTLLMYLPLFSCPCYSTSASSESVTGEPHLTQVGIKFTLFCALPLLEGPSHL